MSNLKEKRQEKKISQIEMAKRLGISYQNYRNYESGNYIAMSEEIRDKIREILQDSEYEYQR